MVQVKWATWATRATMNQRGLSDFSFGQEPKTAIRVGKTR